MSKDVRSITPNPDADFTPTLQPYQDMQPFRFWCQTVLPNVYDDSLSYYELLTKVVEFLNIVIENNDAMHMDVTNMLTAYNQLQAYVNNYFNSLDVQEEINNKLDAMVKSGELLTIINPTVISAVDAYLASHLTNTSPPVDNTFTISGAAADSATVGNKTFWNRGLISTTTTPTDETNFLYNHTDIGRFYVGTSNARRLQDLPDELKTTANGLMVLNFPSIQADAFIFQVIFSYKGQSTTEISNYPLFYRNVFPDGTSTSAFPKATPWAKIATAEDVNNLQEKVFADRGAIATTTTPTDETNYLYNHTQIGRFYVAGSQSQRIQDLPTDLSGQTRGIALLNFPSIQDDAFTLQMLMGYDGVNPNAASSYPIYYRNVCSITSAIFPKATPWNKWLLADTTFSVSGAAADSLTVGNKTFWNRGNITTNSNADDPANLLYTYNKIGRYNCGTSAAQKLQDLPTQLVGKTRGLCLLNFPSIQGDAFTMQVLMSYVGGNTSTIQNYPIFYRNICNIESSAFPKATPWAQLYPQVNSLTGVRVTLLGDSITEQNWRATTGWAAMLANSGAIVQNLAQSSFGFVSVGEAYRYQSKINSINANTQLIGVSTSFNDMRATNPMGNPGDTSGNTICSLTLVTLRNIMNKFPTVPICVYTTNPWGDWHYGVEKSDLYINNVEEICKILGLPFKSLYTSCSLYPWIEANATYYFTPESQPDQADTVHPNTQGQKLLFEHIYPFLLECFPVMANYYTPQATT